VKLTCHEKIVGCPALRCSAEFGDNAAGNRPFSARGGAGLLSRKSRRREAHGLQARHPNILICDAADPPPQLVRRIAQQGHHVDDFEIINQFASHFPGTREEEIQPHFLYHLGPAITPNGTVKTGNLFWAARIYAHIDLLLTSETIAEAGVKTRVRLEKASKN
jgi:hypothetical protein